MSKKQKPTKEKKVEAHVFFLLDETGSMEPRKKDTIGGFNAYVASLKKSMGDKCKFTLVFFNSLRVDIRLKDALLDNVPMLNNENYRPAALTPLYDAIGKTIRDADDKKARRVVFVILTDGEENHSKEFNLTQVKAIIEERQKKGWVFEYLGVGLDNFLDAAKVGIVTNTSYARVDFCAGTGAVLGASHAHFACTGNYERWDDEDKEKKS